MNKLFQILILLAFGSAGCLAQNNYIKGYILNNTDGTPVQGANISLEGTRIGATSNESGFFTIRKIPPGDHILVVSFIGFQDNRQGVTVTETSAEQLTIRIKPEVVKIDEVRISAARQRWLTRNQVSNTYLTRSTIDRIPSLTGQSDLAQFIQVIPGVVSSGDHGGQLYIRGGAPVHNRITLDGLTIISPFHSDGMSSVFDPDFIGSADIYTAGFNAQYGGKISSVMDIRSKESNRTATESKITAGTLGYNLMINGPILRMKQDDARSLSYMVSSRNSWLHRSSELLYPWLDSAGLPFRYNDLIAKVTLVGRNGDQLSLMGQYLTDLADFTSVIQTNWTNKSAGIRLILSPPMIRSQLVASFGISDYIAQFQESGFSPRNNHYNVFEARMGTNSYFSGFEFRWAMEITGHFTTNNFRDINGVNRNNKGTSTEFASFGLFRITKDRWLIEPGFHIRLYASQPHVSPEPRLQVRYNIAKSLSLNLATGLYSQEVASITAEQDVINTFQGYFTSIGFQESFKGRLIANSVQKAWHGVLGISWLSPGDLKINAELYVKDYYRLINANRNRIYEDYAYSTAGIPDYLKRYFIPERGWAYGFDILADYTSGPFNLWTGYSLGFTTREDEVSWYHPHFDRRHNLNLMFNYLLLKKWTIKCRWNLGSGFPFTQVSGYYEDLTFDRNTFLQDFITNGNARLYYSPYNEGRLPWFHRLDISVQRTWALTKKITVEINAGIINVYNRKNVFYIDRFTGRRIDQLPVMPNAALVVRFN